MRVSAIVQQCEGAAAQLCREMDLFETLGLGPRPAEENAVSYAVYPHAQPAGEGELLALQARCLQIVQPLLASCGSPASASNAGSASPYIWQCDGFSLTPSCWSAPPWDRQRPSRRARRADGAAAPAEAPGATATAAPPSAVPLSCLWGHQRWGDNVEDEWWVVYLLRRITALVPDVSARVWDNDGEFLLIEAAYALPRWVKPETASNRVWLHRGELHVVPPPSATKTGASAALPAFPTLAQSLQVLASGQVDTRLPKAEALIRARLDGFPQAAQAAGRHVARALLPPRLARVLQRDPQLVAAAVEAFFYRDAEDMKAAARMQGFPPGEPRTCARVATNRCQHAQLAQQRYEPPRALAQGLPPPSSAHPLAGAADRGLKLTAGFEMLLARAQRMGAAPPPPPPRPTAPSVGNAAGSAAQQGDAEGGGAGGATWRVSRHPAWAPFLSSLQANGFFGSELEGSARHQALTQAAVRDFEAALASSSAGAPADPAASTGQAPAAPVLLPAQRLLQLLSELDSPTGATGEEALAPWQHQAERGDPLVTQPDDDDAWMEGMGARLEQELGQREREAQAPGAAASGVQAQRQEELDAAQLAGSVRGFVADQRAGVEGAEVRGRGGAGGLFDASALVTQLEQVLGGLLGGAAAAGGGGGAKRPGALYADEVEEDGWETTEGSSFFSDEDEDEEAEEEGEEELVDSEGGAEDEEEGRRRADVLVEEILAQQQQQPAASSGGQAAAAQEARGGQQAPAGAGTGARRGGTPAAASGAAAAAAAAAAGAAGGAPASSWPARASLAALQQRWEVCTATDSDDEDDDDEGEESGDEEDEDEEQQGADEAAAASSRSHPSKRPRKGAAEGAFRAAYDQVLSEQLAGTTLDATVDRAAAAVAQQAPPAGPAAAAAARNGEAAAAAAAPLTPLDLDMNLVHSLLKSVASQQGQAGPASNLAGLMGVKLPHGATADPDHPLNQRGAAAAAAASGASKARAAVARAQQPQPQARQQQEEDDSLYAPG